MRLKSHYIPVREAYEALEGREEIGNTIRMANKGANPSFLQLSFFTLFLFLLVAIPYSVYLKATSPKKSVHITNLQNIATPTTPTPAQLTPPTASGATNCLVVPENYKNNSSATPSSYLIDDNGQKLCFPPALPPFPFIWTTYKDYSHGFHMDIPSNWTEKVTTEADTTMHNYYQETPTASSAADISFGWYTGADKLASDSSLLKQQITNGTIQGTVYTKGRAFITSIFPKDNGYLLIRTTAADAAFYAFHHMILSLQFDK